MSEQNNSSSENKSPDVNSPRNSPLTITVETDVLPTPPSEVDTVEVMPPTPPELENKCCDEKECCSEDAKCCEDKKECCEEKECCSEHAKCCEDKKECCEEKECCSEEKKKSLTPLEIPSPNIETPSTLSVDVEEEHVSKKPFFDENELRKDVNTLSQCITLLLATTDVADKYALVIDGKTHSILNSLLENDKYFDIVEDLFKGIIQDGKIDANDVPHIMNLLVDLYVLLKNKKLKFTLVDCGEVLKTIFTVLVKEEIIPINDKEVELLHCLYKIIEMSVHLSQTGDESEKEGLFACLKNCFK